MIHTIDSNKSSYLGQNHTQINTSLQQIHQPILKSVSEASKSPLTQLSESQQYNITSNQEKAPNSTNFITLSKITEQERIEIIQTGFQLQATDPNSLFQLKGYNIKYETIRRTKLYQSLKE